MNSVAPFEPATPAMIVGRAFDDRAVPLGLDQPFALLGGDRLGPAGIPFLVMHEHQPNFLRWVESSCQAQLAAERPWFGAPPLILTGPQGAGRTHAARWLARTAGVPHAIVNLTDPLIAANFAASRSVNETLWASPITIAMAASQCANPIVTVLGADQVSDDVSAGLAAMMDPDLCRAWAEDQLQTYVDLGEVTWIVQCDEPGKLPRAIRRGASLVHLMDAPHGDDHVLALSIALEVMGDLGVDPGDPAYSWSRIQSYLPNHYGARHAKRLYAGFSIAVASIRNGTPADDLDPY